LLVDNRCFPCMCNTTALCLFSFLFCVPCIRVGWFSMQQQQQLWQRLTSCCIQCSHSLAHIYQSRASYAKQSAGECLLLYVCVILTLLHVPCKRSIADLLDHKTVCSGHPCWKEICLIYPCKCDTRTHNNTHTHTHTHTHTQACAP